jgi:hypothetical protein
MTEQETAASPQMIQIKHRYSGVVLFECESGMSMRAALERATTAKANLRGANLSYADLSYANLLDANLRGANLSYADLRGANLSDANLSYADLRGANLSGANLSYADLRGANLSDDKKLIGNRPFFTIGPIGSRSDYIQAFITDGGLMIRAGCFFDTRDQFELALNAKHGDNEHGQEYRAALVLIDKHAELWEPKAEAPKEVEVTP